ncbi:hypothetical protein KDD93_05435 [Campylobacter sp. faydin G-24]|uniref:Uncharacterized protein n=1 Tax=Campylobacter anatolicus TaxID=2829105 RepID=A0ABS5HIC8_9BACT|nr:hypothetical protein [Campylobacter anatolicus]MBR8464013.1 hypothetical protein [Campylobacter anatolicus]
MFYKFLKRLLPLLCIFVIFTECLQAGNLLQLIALAQSATRQNLINFNKNQDENKRVKLSFSGRYTFVPNEQDRGIKPSPNL